MDHKEFRSLLSACPVIAAVKTPDMLERCLESDCQIVFLLCGDIMSVGSMVEKIKNDGRIALVHIDLIEGLSAKDIAVDFIKNNTRADGIISTKAPLIRRGRELSLLTVQRFFLLDSMALSSATRQLSGECADAAEILPGVMPRVIRSIAALCHVPVIAGGLIADKTDVLEALSAGAVSVSSSKPDIWFL